MSPPSITPTHPILIIGAGPAGLALAQLLRLASIPYRIFDRDASEAAREQGWAVALQWILPELRATLEPVLGSIEPVSHLHEQGLKGERTLANGETGEEVMRKDADEEFFRADRKKLREWLGQGLDVEWGRYLVGISEGEGRVECEFENGEKVVGCAVVGADGAKSRVRAHLIPNSSLTQAPYDSVFGRLTVSRAESDQLCKTYARSVFAGQAPTVFLFASLHYIDDAADQAHWYWSTVHQQSSVEKHTNMETCTAPQLWDLANKWSETLAPKYREIVRRTKPEDCMVLPAFLTMWSPAEEDFKSETVTLMGDAAHKMPPLGGMGVNHAIQDAFDFCAILKSKGNIAQALGEYGRMMSKRGREGVHQATSWPVIPV